MIDIITQDIIFNQYKKYNLIPIESIVKQSAKIKTKCKCGSEFLSRPCDVRRDLVKSCGHCNDPKIGYKIGSLTVMIYIPDKANGCQVVCQCDCGEWIKMISGGRLKSGQIKSCGHCSDPKIGDRVGDLIIKQIIPARHKGCKVICDCDCGGVYGPIKYGALSKAYKHGQKITCGKCNIPKIGDRYNKLTITNVYPGRNGGSKVDTICDCGNKSNGLKYAVLTNGNKKSCGFCKTPIVGEKYGKLTITKVELNKTTREVTIETICDCGNIYVPNKSYVITSGNTKSCGNCGIFKNGVATSFIALELHNIIEEIVGHKCEHNYKIGKKSFDIVDLDNKIVIEYDEYHWHRVMRDTSRQEKNDTRLALRRGFKILRIRASRDLPTKEEIKKVINNHFQHGHKQHTITTAGWKKMDK